MPRASTADADYMSDIEIDVELVRELVSAQFPQWSNLPICAVKPGGWDNRTFRLGENMSVRLPSAERYAAQVTKEQRWLCKLAPHLPLSIPEPLALGMPAFDYPWSWSVYRWLEGEPASAEKIADPLAFARALALFLSALHRIDATHGPPAGEHNFHRGGNLSIYDEEVRAALSSLGHSIEVQAALAIWQRALVSTWQYPPVWVHGDIASGNLLVQNGALSAVIDFGCLSIGDPACDLVIAWTLLPIEARQTFRSALALDDNTWHRARGWALWKALITIAGPNPSARDRAASVHTLSQLLSDPH